MRPSALLLLLAFLASAGRGEEGDPPATEPLVIEVGTTAPMTEAPGASVLCDDPTVAAPEFTADGSTIVLRGLKPGSTLCGLWLVGQKPGGLYRVRIVPAPSDAGAPPL
jgi:hypothetical protein